MRTLLQAGLVRSAQWPGPSVNDVRDGWQNFQCYIIMKVYHVHVFSIWIFDMKGNLIFFCKRIWAESHTNALPVSKLSAVSALSLSSSCINNNKTEWDYVHFHCFLQEFFPILFVCAHCGSLNQSIAIYNLLSEQYLSLAGQRFFSHGPMWHTGHILRNPTVWSIGL